MEIRVTFLLSSSSFLISSKTCGLFSNEWMLSTTNAPPRPHVHLPSRCHHTSTTPCSFVRVVYADVHRPVLAKNLLGRAARCRYGSSRPSGLGCPTCHERGREGVSAWPERVRRQSTMWERVKRMFWQTGIALGFVDIFAGMVARSQPQSHPC